MRMAVIMVALLGAAFVLFSSLFTVSEIQQAVVTQLGKPVRVVKNPGLHFKLPFFQQVIFFDNRLLDYDSAPTEVVTKDKKALVVDNYSRWRIKDPLLMLQTVQNENGAQARLDDIIYSELRLELGLHSLIEIVASKRKEIFSKVTASSNEKAKEYGIEIIDVRVKRADLPPENEKAVFGRMRAERQRIARQYRSEGKEEALKIRSKTDKLRTILLADAYQQEQILRGNGDASAVTIYAEAFERDQEFYAFIRTLEAYKQSLKSNTTVILPPDSQFLRYIKEAR
ncbi:MAG: protease modulator HflC [Nitrospinae bacterium]|nr:protease modulator HflC [Nitrospinota bacterium]MCH7767962.1 protease modulator HflC [Nitrospinota bacterium]